MFLRDGCRKVLRISLLRKGQQQYKGKDISILQKFGAFLSSDLARNTFYLYLSYAANWLLPLLILPYLSRVLTPHGFGVYVAGQALGVALSMFLETSFSFSGTREVSRWRENPAVLGRIYMGVLGAKGLFSILSTAIAFASYLFVPIFRNDPLVVFSALFYALATGLSPVWFYRGLEKMAIVALLDFSPRVLSFVATLFLVKRPEDAYLAIFVSGMAMLITSVLGILPLLGMFRFTQFNIGDVWYQVGLGARLLPFVFFQGIHTIVNSIALGFFVSNRELGLFLAAERLIRSLSSVLEPISRGIFPRLAFLFPKDEQEARRLFSSVLSIVIYSSAIITVLIEVLAPFLVDFLLGPFYEESIRFFRVMAPMFFFNAIFRALGVVWSVATGKESLLNLSYMVAVVLQILVAVLGGATWGALGVAWGTLAVSIVQVAILWWGLKKLYRWPLIPR